MASFFSGAVSSSHCSGVFGSGFCGIADILACGGNDCRMGYNLAVKRVVIHLLYYLVVAALDAFIAWFCFRIFDRNPSTVGFVFLLAILIVSATWGLRLAVFMAVLATLL